MYAKIQMKDHGGNDVEGIGVVLDGIVVASVARIGSKTWKENSQGAAGSFTRNLGFADVSIHAFKQTSEPDEKGFVTGELGTQLVVSTPMYLKQYKAPDGAEGDPFFNCILDYEYRTGPKANQMRSVISLFGEGIKEAIIESLNKSFEVLNERSQAGENIRRSSNAAFARLATAAIQTVEREAEKRGATPNHSVQAPHVAADASEEAVTADDVIPQ